VIALQLEQGMRRETGIATSAKGREENMRVWRGNKARNPAFLFLNIYKRNKVIFHINQ
jgi:hypothetical protein